MAWAPPGGYPGRTAVTRARSPKAKASASSSAPAVGARAKSPDGLASGPRTSKASPPPRQRTSTAGSGGRRPSIQAEAACPKTDGAAPRSAAAEGARPRADGTAPRSAASAASPGKMSEQEVMAVWRMLDRRNAGEVKIADLVQNSVALQRRCPELLEQYDKIVRGGKLTLNDLKRYYGITVSAASRGKTNGDQSSKTSSGLGGKDVSSEELRSIWSHLDSESCGQIGLPELMHHASFLLTKLPDIINKFEEIDRDRDLKISFEDILVFFSTEAWLQAELRKVVGLQGLKEQLMRFQRSIALDRQRAADGFEVSTGGKLHMIFRGNPGTGKTSMGRIMAKLLHRIGIVPTSSFREVQRPDLVAEYVGQTGPKTRKVIEETKTGVLFIDEAYRLSSGGKTDFGKEAIEELMSKMNDPPGKAPVQIYAGYSQDMDEWMKANEGLYRRIAYTFDFQDYSLLELAEILHVSVEQKGFKLEAALHGAAGKSRLAQLLGQYTLPRTRQLMNGGLCERIFESAKQCLDARDNPAQPSVTLIEADLVAACKQIPPPPEPAPSVTLAAQAAHPPALPAMPATAVGHSTGQGCLTSHNPPTTVAAASTTAQRFLVLRLRTGSLSDLRALAFVAGVVKPMSPYVVVSFGGAAGEGLRQAWKSFKDKRGHLEPSWEETAVLPLLPQEQLLHISVYDRQSLIGDRFLGNAQLALSAVPQAGFNGQLSIRKDDSQVGTLCIELYWQFGTGSAGQAADAALFGSGAAAVVIPTEKAVTRPKAATKGAAKTASKSAYKLGVRHSVC